MFGLKTNEAFLPKIAKLQVFAIVLFWLLLIYCILKSYAKWDSMVSITSFVSIPAAIAIIGQLVIASHISRASYIRDYALKFRTDKELTESFHYLVYKCSNELFDIYVKPDEERSQEEQKKLNDSQLNVPNDLQFFDPDGVLGLPQERRIDNVLGFFDTVGYDLKKGTVNINDVSGVFGYHLAHLIQRCVVQKYLENVHEKWPTKKSFQDINASEPFGYLKYMIASYEAHQKFMRYKKTN